MPIFFIDIKEKGAKKAELNIKSLTKTLTGMAGGFLIAQKAADLLKQSITMSAEMEGVRRGFNNLARSSGFSASAFNKFKKATDGTIDSLTLMQKANNAMLLGIADSEQQMADMFDIAQRLGQSLGIDTTQSIDSLVTGLGRQSKLMLDNLGIMVDTEKVTKEYAESIGKTVSELTDQERKQAFVNGAMKEANRLVEQLGDEQLTAKDAIAQAVTASKDLGVAVGDQLNPVILEATSRFTGAAEAVTKYLKSLEDLSLQEIRSINNSDELKNRLKGIQQEIEFFQNMVSPSDPMFTESSVGTKEIEKLKEEQKIIESQLQRLRLLQSPIEGDTMTVQTEEESKKTNAELDKSIGKYVKLGQEKKKSTTATKKLSEEELKAMALTGNSAKSAMATVVKAKLMEAVSGKIASVFKTVPFPLNMLLAAGAGGAVSSLFDNAVGDIKEFATGGDFVTNGKQLIMVGDNPSGRERVQITPLGGDPAPDAPSGSNITVNISAPLVDETVVDHIIPAINDAVRRGETLATS